MNEETQQKIIQCIQQGLIKSTIEKDIAQAIKLSVDALLGGSWQCIVGKDFTCSVTYETKDLLLVSFSKLNVLVFKSYEQIIYLIFLLYIAFEGRKYNINTKNNKRNNN